MKLPVSLIILCENPQALVISDLQHYGTYFSEILLVDTSPDQLLSHRLPKSLPVRFLQRPFKSQNFSTLRNSTLSEVTQPWMLFLDSDERLSTELLTQLPSLISQEYAAFAFRRQDFFHTRPLQYGEVGTVFKVRLAQTEKITFLRPVHELAHISGTSKRTNLVIEHFPHPDIASFFKKISRYAFLQAQAEYQAGHRCHWWEIFLKPSGKFVVNYFLKLGFLDGYPGIVYATLMSFHSLWVRIYLYEIATSTV